MLLGGYLHRRDRRALLRRIDELAETFPTVRERARDKAADLSGGQRRIVEFARALVTRPSVVLLDEPTLGLDPHTCEVVFRTTRTINDLGATVLMVEQNVRFGLTLAGQGIVMERGQVLLAGPARGSAGPAGHGRALLRRRRRRERGPAVTADPFAHPAPGRPAHPDARHPSRPDHRRRPHGPLDRPPRGTRRPGALDHVAADRGGTVRGGRRPRDGRLRADPRAGLRQHRPTARRRCHRHRRAAGGDARRRPNWSLAPVGSPRAVSGRRSRRCRRWGCVRRRRTR